MKLLVFRTGKSKKRSGSANNIKFNMERFLFFSCVFTFVALILIQAAMVNPSVRTFLVNDGELEGRPLEMEEYLYDEGQISIALCDDEPNEDLKVLINGVEAAVFSTSVIQLNVKDMDVIHIDASGVDEAEVEIISASENIKCDNMGKKIQLNSELKKLTRINID